MKTILITGVNGFVGQHVAEQLHDRGVEVIGVGNQPELDPVLESIVANYVACDLTDPLEVQNINIKGVDAIINLAGFAKVGESEGQGELYNRVNVGVHTVLYGECLKQETSPRIIAISTGAVYDPLQELPITENSALVADDKTNEYVISKKLMEQSVLQFNDKGLRCIIVRPFNHTGPGQLPGFLLPDLYEQMSQSQESGQPMLVGNLETKRDFTDVRDVARAYVELAMCDDEKLEHNIYNVCSGKSVAGKTVLEMLAKAMNIVDFRTISASNKKRKNEVMDIYGSHDRISAATGWKPDFDIQQTIEDFVAWKRAS